MCVCVCVYLCVGVGRIGMCEGVCKILWYTRKHTSSRQALTTPQSIVTEIDVS